jgi:hypothetical protein
MLAHYGIPCGRTRIKSTLSEDRFAFSIMPRSLLLRIKNISDKCCRETRNTHIILNLKKNYAVCEIMWKNVVEQGRLQTTIWRMRIACWMPKATYTRAGCVIFLGSPLQQWLHGRSSKLRYTYIASLVLYYLEVEFCLRLQNSTC